MRCGAAPRWTSVPVKVEVRPSPVSGNPNTGPTLPVVGRFGLAGPGMGGTGRCGASGGRGLRCGLLVEESDRFELVDQPVAGVGETLVDLGADGLGVAPAQMPTSLRWLAAACLRHCGSRVYSSCGLYLLAACTNQASFLLSPARLISRWKANSVSRTRRWSPAATASSEFVDKPGQVARWAGRSGLLTAFVASRADSSACIQKMSTMSPRSSGSTMKPGAGMTAPTLAQQRHQRLPYRVTLHPSADAVSSSRTKSPGRRSPVMIRFRNMVATSSVSWVRRRLCVVICQSVCM